MDFETAKVFLLELHSLVYICAIFTLEETHYYSLRASEQLDNGIFSVPSDGLKS